MSACRAARSSLSALGVLCSVGLSESAANDTTEPKWIQCCVEGVFLGHPKFKEINWTPAVFQKLIDNLHRHPSFRAGPDGVGCARVVPWDYEHANEIAKMKGVFPPGGLPSESWTYDLQIRKGEDGKAELWALTEWLPEAREQVRTGKYIGCSVCVLPSYVDPVSGDDQGPTLTSIALTNDPFVQGMAPLTATLEQWGPAESPFEALVGVCRILELPTNASAQDALDQLQALTAAIASNSVPAYVDLPSLLDRIRRLLKLPLLATPDELLGGAVAALSGLETTPAGSTALTQSETPMTLALLQTLSVILGCQPTEPAILQAAKDAGKAAENAESAQAAVGAIDQLKTLFGSGDTDKLIAQATKAIADAKALEPAVAALAEARKALRGNAESDAEQEAEAVTASLSGGDPELGKRFKPVVLASRLACITEHGVVDQAKLDRFRSDYPLPAEQRALLTRNVVAGDNGVQLGGAATGYRTVPITQSGSQGGAPASDPEVQKIVEAINATEGRNAYDKANNLLCTRSASHKALPLAEQHRVAGEFTRTVLAGKVPAGFKL